LFPDPGEGIGDILAAQFEEDVPEAIHEKMKV
jgi:hypothetical protein